MMNRAKGPVWHKKHKEKGIIPKGLRGLDREATWCKSHADNWVYGHGSFTLASHRVPFLGCFMWMRNSANEAKRMWLETGYYNDLIDFVAMDSKADDYALYRELKRQRQIMLITSNGKRKPKSKERRRMHRIMRQPQHRKIFKERGHRVEPMQGLVKEIFDLERCWMRRDCNNRWLFAAMGVAVQMHQLIAYRQNRSTWNIKEEVLG